MRTIRRERPSRFSIVIESKHCRLLIFSVLVVCLQLQTSLSGIRTPSWTTNEEYFYGLPSVLSNLSDSLTTTYITVGDQRWNSENIVDYVRDEHQTSDDETEDYDDNNDEDVIDPPIDLATVEKRNTTAHRYDIVTAEENDPLLNILPATYRHKKIPVWMKEYFDWHRIQTAGLTEENWRKEVVTQEVQNITKKYLIVDCFSQAQCGGLSDRIKPLLLFVAIAAHQPPATPDGLPQRRILMIIWDRPHPLEEFLLPNEVNWTLPSYMVQTLQERAALPWGRRNGRYNIVEYYKRRARYLFHRENENVAVMLSRKQLTDGGAGHYQCIMDNLYGKDYKDGENELLNNLAEIDWESFCKEDLSGETYRRGMESYIRLYHDFFRTLFRPSKPIAALIEAKLQAANLKPKEFVGAHYRANYKKRKEDHVIERKASTIARCAALSDASYPVYFASDTDIALNAIEAEAMGSLAQKNITVVTPLIAEKRLTALNGNNITAIKQPLHLDMDQGAVKDFYPTFVDILVMGESRCQLYGIGGFGQFASLLSYNASCYYNYRSQRHCQQSNVDLPAKCCIGV